MKTTIILNPSKKLLEIIKRMSEEKTKRRKEILKNWDMYFKK